MADNAEPPSEVPVSQDASSSSSEIQSQPHAVGYPIATLPTSCHGTIKNGDGGYIWLMQDSASADGVTPSLWQPLRRTDQVPLEKAEAASEPKVVAVDGGRAEVRLDERLWVDRYGTVPSQAPRKVRRSLWCRWDKTSSGWEPYEEDINLMLEEAYHRLVEKSHGISLQLDVSKEIEEIVQLVAPYDGRRATMKLRCVTERAGVFSDTRASCYWSLVAMESDIESSWFSYTNTDCAMQRGFGELAPFKSEVDIPLQFGEAEESVLSQDVDRIYVVVHGIGEKIWSQAGSGQTAQVPKFRQYLHQCRLGKLGFRPTEGGYIAPDKNESLKIPKEDIIMVAWWEAIHSEDHDHRLQRITLPSIQDVRQIANFAVSDVLYFSQDAHREKIIKAVSESVESALKRFRQYHPNFNGDVVLIGHSLGGVILFESLRNSRFPTTPAALFMLGSPLGMFLHCQDAVPPPDYALPNGTRLFNVFHPLDPIAYRMEPLLQPHLVDVPPEQIPTKGLFGERKIHTGIRQLWNWAAGDKAQTWESAGGQWLNLNKGQRVDWALQEELSLLGGASDTLNAMNALASHSCYIKSADVAALIHNQCVAFAASSESAEPHNECVSADPETVEPQEA